MEIVSLPLCRCGFLLYRLPSFGFYKCGLPVLLIAINYFILHIVDQHKTMALAAWLLEVIYAFSVIIAPNTLHTIRQKSQSYVQNRPHKTVYFLQQVCFFPVLEHPRVLLFQGFVQWVSVLTHESICFFMQVNNLTLLMQPNSVHHWFYFLIPSQLQICWWYSLTIR